MPSPSRISLSTPTTQYIGETSQILQPTTNPTKYRLEAGKLRNVAKFYSHLLHTGKVFKARV